MPRVNKILIRTGSTAPTAGDFATSEPAWDSSNKKFYIKAADGSMVEIGAGGGGSSSLVTASTTAGFPATGSTSALYLSQDQARLFQWTGTVYAEVGAVSAYDSRWDAFLPPAPTNVSGTAGNGQVSLTWTAPTVLSQTPITDYVVQYATSPFTSWTTFSDSVSASASATVNSLTNGSAYQFRVAAVNSVGQGAFSTASSSVTPTAGDPLFSSVALLLHGDGSGATITDSSGSPKTITAYGNATQSTTQSKFGGKSISLDGTNSYLSLTSTGFTLADDFTIEAWVYMTSTITYAPLIEGRTTASYQNYICGLYNYNGGYRLDFVTAGGEYSRLTASSTAVPLNEWVHVAFIRSGGVLSCYVNGTKDSATISYSSSMAPAASTLTIGKNVDGNYFPGFIDEFRVTIGSARYSGATFNVPTAAFPDA